MRVTFPALITSIALGLAAAYVVSAYAQGADDLVVAPDTMAKAPGMKETELVLPSSRALRAAIWYPAGPGGNPRLFARNPVFVGVPIREDAPLPQGRHPLILLSHGLGGNYRSLGWLAAGLSARGAIVVAVNHPGSTTGDVEFPGAMHHWTRAADLQGAMDVLLTDPQLGALIDTDRIAVAGFSYGGFTALSLGGLRGNLKGYANHCTLAKAISTHCADLAEAGLDLLTLDAEAWNADYRDPRVSHVVAIDPGLIWGQTPTDTAALAVPSLLISLGTGSDRLYETDTRQSGLDALLPAVAHVAITPARHYSALPTCTAEGPAIIASEGEPPICTDPPRADRNAIHARMIAVIADFLNL